jgi:uncharacterized repeat protein (TIGR03803 family)
MEGNSLRVKLALVLFSLCLFTLCAGCALAADQSAPAYTFVCSGSGLGPCPNGGRPDSLIIGSDGNFYGAAQVTTWETSLVTGGNIFSLTPAGKFTVLHTFSPGVNKNFPDGDLPFTLTEGPDGNLYGATIYGGVDGCDGDCGYGVLFRVGRTGTGFQLVHKFCSQTDCSDGSLPTAMVVGTDGNLYGTTSAGGSDYTGTIFRVTPSSGAYKVVFNFSSSHGGQNPSNLIAGPDGTFYGTSSGTTELLFHYTPATGVVTTAPLNFPALSHGSGLALGPNGNFYGFYFVYGINGVSLFEVEPNGGNLQIFPFYNTIDGGGTPDGLLLASDGNFWVADYNGSSEYGDIISLSPTDGSLLQTLTPFGTTSSIGGWPAGLVQASDGTLWGPSEIYGSASKGHFALGTVFNVNAGLPAR